MAHYNSSTMGPNPVYMFRRNDNVYTELEKRQLFLRSYQFSRKKSLGERMKRSLFRVRKLMIWVRLKTARNLRRTIWLKIKNGFFFVTRRRRNSRSSFARLRGYSYYNGCYYSSSYHGVSRTKSCLW